MWSLVFVFIYPLGTVFLFASILWYFGVPKMAKQKRKTVALKAVVSHLCRQYPNARLLFLNIPSVNLQFEEPCRILSRDQCLYICEHNWKSLDEHEAAGSMEKRLLGGEAYDNFQKAAENAAATVLSAATATQDAVLHSASATPSPAVGPPVGILGTNTPATPLVVIPPNQPESQPPVDTQQSFTLSGGRLGNDDIQETEQQPSDEGGGGGGGGEQERTSVEDLDAVVEEDNYKSMTDAKLRGAVSKLVDELVENVSGPCSK